MTEGVDDFLLLQDFSAYGAVDALGEAGLGAGRRHGIVCHFGMAQGIFGFLGFQNLSADGAVTALREAGFSTGWRNCFICHFGMAQRGSFCLPAF